MKRKILSFFKAHLRFFGVFLRFLNYLNPKNRLPLGKTEFSLGFSRLSGVRIIDHGSQNRVMIEDFCKLKNCTIIISGNHNTIKIGKHCGFNNVGLFTEDDGNTIEIGEYTNIISDVDMSAIEGTRIIIGKNCLFSNDLHFRTGDSHSIVDMSGQRINPSEDIIIGDHVWIGTKVTCLKGVQIADNCVVAATTTLCKKYTTPNCLIGGVPGKVLKENISWDAARL